MRLTLKELRVITKKLYDHLEEQNKLVFDIEKDYYWYIPEDIRYNPTHIPSVNELTLGQLTENGKELKDILSGKRKPISYGLVWISAILQAIGEDNIS